MNRPDFHPIAPLDVDDAALERVNESPRCANHGTSEQPSLSSRPPSTARTATRRAAKTDKRRSPREFPVDLSP